MHWGVRFEAVTVFVIKNAVAWYVVIWFKINASSRRDQATVLKIRVSDRGKDKRFFPSPKRLYIWDLCFGGYFPGIKLPGFEADHQPSSSA